MPEACDLLSCQQDVHVEQQHQQQHRNDSCGVPRQLQKGTLFRS